MRILTLLILVFAVILGVSFAALNAGSVTVNYYIGTQSIPLSLLLLGILVIGLLIGYFASFLSRFRAKMEIRRLRKFHD
jgi:putative membrane protein